MHFGEDSREMSGGIIVSTEGSWEAGVDGALPGIVILAAPTVGEEYRQEYYKGVAQDMAEVLALNESTSVPYGTFNNCLITKDRPPLEKGVAENKYYEYVVGLLKEILVDGDTGYMELVDIMTILAGGGFPTHSCGQDFQLRIDLNGVPFYPLSARL